MAGRRFPDRFGPDELAGAELRAGERAELLSAARELEWLAATEDISPSEAFEDRVMAAIAAEPAPRPVAAVIGAARRRRPASVLAALRDLWRVAWSGGRPLAVRAPAMALVLVLLVGSVGLGSLGAAAALGLLDQRTPEAAVSPAPSPAPSSGPTLGPTEAPSASPSPSPSPEPSESAEPAESPGASEPPEPSDPDEAAEAPGSTQEPAGTEAARTPRPTDRPDPEPTKTPGPDETEGPGGSPRPSETPEH
jgi:hypothetical protein